MRSAIAALLLLGFAGAVRGQDAPRTGLEYRLTVPDGVPFAFDHSEEKYFSALPFMTAKDFARVTVHKSKNPNTPGDWEIELTHTALGRAKYRAVADADRSRDYCLVFHSRLYQCLAFPPVQKGLYDKGIVLNDRFNRDQAQALAREMRREIAKAR